MSDDNPHVERIWGGRWDLEQVTPTGIRTIQPGDRILVSAEQAADHPKLYKPLPDAPAATDTAASPDSESPPAGTDDNADETVVAPPAGPTRRKRPGDAD